MTSHLIQTPTTKENYITQAQALQRFRPVILVEQPEVKHVIHGLTTSMT
jgi:hypothetical protein